MNFITESYNSQELNVSHMNDGREGISTPSNRPVVFLWASEKNNFLLLTWV